MKILWTPKAKQTFESILEWLTESWGRVEIEKFIYQTESIIERIKNNPYLYTSSNKNNLIRRGFVNKIVSLYYQVKPRKNEIILLAFWDNRQEPKKNHYY